MTQDAPYNYSPLDPAGQLLERNIQDLSFCPYVCLQNHKYLLTFHVGTDLQWDPSFPEAEDVDVAWFGPWQNAPKSLDEMKDLSDSGDQRNLCLTQARLLVTRVKDEHIVRFRENDVTGSCCSTSFFTHQVLLLQVKDNRIKAEVEKAFNQIQTLCNEPNSQTPSGKLRILGALCASAMKSKVIRRQAAKGRMLLEDEKAFLTSRWEKVGYLVCPPCFFFMAFSFQSFMLHVCTHFYIKFMEKEEHDGLHGEGRLFDIIGNLVATTVAQDMATGAVKVPLWLLDLSGATPIALCMFANVFGLWSGSFSIGLWNKQFIVGAAMAFLKGVFDVVTVMPDSIGWDTCKERLHKSGVSAFDHVNFLKDFWSSLQDMLFVELFGDGTVARVRYCADMMISGHTYFAFLFSIGAYNAIRLNANMFPGVRNIFLGRLVFWTCIACLLTELMLVGLARFHYTVDMLAALVLVLLLYDSRTVDQIAADWAEGFRWRDPDNFVPHLSLRALWLGRRKVVQMRTQQRIVPSKATQVMSMRDTTGSPPWSYPPDPYAYAKPQVKPGGTDTVEITTDKSPRGEVGVDSGEHLPLMHEPSP